MQVYFFDEDKVEIPETRRIRVFRRGPIFRFVTLKRQKDPRWAKVRWIQTYDGVEEELIRTVKLVGDIPVDSAACAAFAAEHARTRECASTPSAKVLKQLREMHDQGMEDTNVISPCLDSEFGASDKLFHLVQQEDLIAQIHNEELPPDCYYEQLEDVLAEMFPESTFDARHHVVALSAAFDTAAAFALSFGVKKFQFMQQWVKLVGEIVGVGGRKPNPVLCEAIRNLSLIHI